MSWWANNSQVAEAPAPERDRREVLMEQFREVETKLADLNLEIAAFRRKHGISTDWFQRIVRLRCETLPGRAAIEAEWRGMIARADRLFPTRNKLLHEIALLKNGSSQ
jgi:hypothetical protein